MLKSFSVLHPAVVSKSPVIAEFIPKKADGSEFSPEVRADLFSKLIKETLGMPLKQEIERLRLRGDSITKEEMEAMSLLNRMLTKHGIS